MGGSAIVKCKRTYTEICPEAFCHRDPFSQRPVVTEAPVAPEARQPTGPPVQKLGP